MLLVVAWSARNAGAETQRGRRDQQRAGGMRERGWAMAVMATEIRTQEERRSRYSKRMGEDSSRVVCNGQASGGGRRSRQVV